MSDYSDALAAYHANAGYAANKSATEAAAFATACRQLAITPPRSEHAGERIDADPGLLNEMAQHATAFANALDGSNVRFVDFRDSRN